MKFTWLKETPLFDPGSGEDPASRSPGSRFSARLPFSPEKLGKIETDQGPIYIHPDNTSSVVTSPSGFTGTLSTAATSSSDGRVYRQQPQADMTESEIRRLVQAAQQQLNNQHTWSYPGSPDWGKRLMDGISGEAKELLARELPRKGFDMRWGPTLDPRQAVWSLVVWMDGSHPDRSVFGALTVPLISEELMYDMATQSPANLKVERGTGEPLAGEPPLGSTSSLKSKIWDKVTERIRDWLDEQPDVVVGWEEPLYDLDGPVEAVVL